MTKILLASDHAGFDLKNIIVLHLIAQGFEIQDYGCY